MDRSLHHHPTTMLDGLKPVLAMAGCDGVPGQAAASEIEKALAPGTLGWRTGDEPAVDAANAGIVGRGGRERSAWRIDEA